MAAYIILDINVTDPTTYKTYTEQAGPALAAYGGKFCVRGGRHEILEGEWKPGRVVVLEFESVERAKEWYASEEYAGPMQIRHSASSANMILVEGA